MEPERVWTAETDENSSIHNIASTPKSRKQINTNLVGVQSRFRRKYFYKSILLVLTTTIISLIVAVIVLSVLYNYRNVTCQTKDCVRAAANLLQSMDKSVDPCEDFYKFTCGNWAEDHPRPDNLQSYDWFTEKQTKVLRNIRQYLQMNSTTNEPQAVIEARKMYSACMDTDAMDKLGLQPVFDYLKEFALPSRPTRFNATDSARKAFKFDWVTTVARINKILGSDILIGVEIFADPKNRTVNRLAIGVPEQGSMLPFNKNYDNKIKRMTRKNLKKDDDEKIKEKEVAYVQYITEVMSAMLFYENPKIDLAKLLPAIQEAAAQTLKLGKIFEEMLNDIEEASSNTNPLDDLRYVQIDEFQRTTDQLIAPKNTSIWRTYVSVLFTNITNVQFDYNKDLILTTVQDGAYLANLTKVIDTTDASDLELYIWWAIVEDLIVHTTNDIRKLYSDYVRKMSSVQSSLPRSIYCTGGVNQMMGMAVSYAIADEQFTTDIKPRVQLMLMYIREAFNNLVRAVGWMDDDTKCATLEKSFAMQSMIGFPEWLTKPGRLDQHYAGVSLNESRHMENMVDLLRRDNRLKLMAFRKVEEMSWATMPTNVNAFHTFQANAITVPISILQYPFYDLGLETLNYGAIGTILGHELTHGFDDSGRMFDKDGNLRQWWSEKTIDEYVNRTNCFIKQYNSYFVSEISEYIDGELTLGENIADNGGLREAFMAYRLYVNEHGKEEMLPGFEDYTHEQLFFMSYGNLWCETQTVTSIEWAVQDSHCPGKVRLKGVLANSPEFRETFNCRPGSKVIAPAQDQCRLW